jgi:hypothetical protein
MKPLETVYWLRLAFGILAALLSVSFLVIAGAVNTNLVLNPSVEVGNAGATAPQNWSSSGNGTEWSTTYARTGSRSLRIDVTNATANWTGEVGQVYGGNTYHVNGFFSGQVVAGQFVLTMRWFSDSQGLAFLGDNNVSLGNYTQWLPQGSDFTAPNGAKSCEIIFRAVNGSGDLYVDDFEVRQTEPVQSFFNSASIAIIVYIASYYVLKSKFGTKVSKPQKILTAGIGIYILAWLVIWALLYTLVAAA